MTDTSFQPSMAIVKAIDADFRRRIRSAESEYEDEMAPLRSEFLRRRNEIERSRKSKIAKAKRWRDNLVRRAGVSPVDGSVAP